MSKTLNKELIGFVEFADEHLPFSFKEWKIKIYFDDFSKFSKYAYKADTNGKIFVDEPNVLETKELNGIDANNNKRVKFILLDSIVYHSTNVPGPSYIELLIDYYSFVDVSEKPGEETTITIWSNELSTFLGVQPHYKTNIIDGGLDGNVSCKSKTLKLISTVEINEYKIEMNPTFRITNSVGNFTFETGLHLKINKSLDIDNIKLYATKMLDCVFFASSRKNINIDEITFRNRTLTGTMVLNIKSYDLERKVSLHPRDELAIPWTIIYPVFASLFKNILKDSIFISHLPEKRIDRYYVDDSSIAKDSSAFEAEFRYLFGSDALESDEETKSIEDEIEKEITDKINRNSGKRKKIYKNLKKHIHDQSLSNKIEYCLEKYKAPLSSFWQKHLSSYSTTDVAETCGGIRNAVNHGRKKDDENMPVADAFFALRALIYVMQLTRLGLDEELIKHAIEHLYRIF